MKAFTVREAVRAIGGRYFGSEAQLNVPITNVTSDSRSVGEGSMFVAFRGARADGHDFIADCLARGAAVCVSERAPRDESEMPCIVAHSSLSAVGALAGWYRGRFELPVIGITGSVGKTTTKEMISAVLSRKFRTHKTQKNFNNELGVPRTVLSLSEDAQAAVIEMGISDFGEMTRLTEMVRPNIAVITVIGDAHLEFLHDHAGVLRAKTEIFKSMQPDALAILNGDDEMLRNYTAPVKTVTYGLGEWNDFVADRVENLGGDGMRMRICHHGTEFIAHVPAFGTHMVYAALAGTAAGWALGLSNEDIAAGIAGYETVGNRARLIDTGKITILSDCYNANPNSTAAALDSLATLPGRRVCILGDMLELGPDSAKLHWQTGKKAADTGVGLIICCGSLAESIAQGAKENGGNALYFPNKEALMKKLPELIRNGDCVLVKASHSMAFEDFVETLQKL